MCSTRTAAIEQIAQAIDQLADSLHDMTSAELTAGVADIWLMMGEIDPELTRRQLHYTAPRDGTPS